MKTTELATLLGIPKLPVYIEQIEQKLEEILIKDNPNLSEPSLRLINSGGKRLRPFLVIAAASSQGGKIDDKVITSCTAIELVHIGTIVHDDIIDNADVRWGATTVNKQEGVNQAILVGDYLLALAAVQATNVSQEVGYIIANTIATMCDGQSQETADEYNIDRSIESYYTTIRKKTASLTSAACRVGGLCVGIPNAQIEALSKYGESFGMAFQLVDDLLDFLSTSEAMGKPVGNDMKEGVYTLPLLLALKGPSGKQIRSWLGKHPDTYVDRSEIIDSLMKTGAIEATLTEVRRHNKTAAATIRRLGDNKVLNGLSKLPDIYLKWALQKQTTV